MADAYTKTFTLTDAFGASHRYQMDALMPDEGMAVCLQIYGILAGPLGEFIRSLMASGSDEAILKMIDGAAAAGEDDDALDDLWELLKDADWSSIAGKLEYHLARPEMIPLCKTLLRHTYRDDKELSDAEYDMAYRANYFEHHRAIWEAIKLNNFFPPSLFSGDDSKQEKTKTGTPPMPTRKPGNGRRRKD